MGVALTFAWRTWQGGCWTWSWGCTHRGEAGLPSPRSTSLCKERWKGRERKDIQAASWIRSFSLPYMAQNAKHGEGGTGRYSLIHDLHGHKVGHAVVTSGKHAVVDNASSACGWRNVGGSKLAVSVGQHDQPATTKSSHTSSLYESCRVVQCSAVSSVYQCCRRLAVA